jgi:hypothetical protein
VPIGFTVDFEGLTASSLYVNNNGNVTFTGPLSTFTPFPIITTGLPMIAPFFADVDTRGAGSGLVHYGTGTYGGDPAFAATWGESGAGAGVGYYGFHTDKLNKFQLILVDRSADTGVVGDFDIIFKYDSIEWETGDASGGIGGLGGSSARAGFSNGSTFAVELPGSAINGAFLDGGPFSLVAGSNVGMPMMWMWEVRDGGVIVSPPGAVPEPATWAVWGGLVALSGVLAWRRRCGAA